MEKQKGSTEMMHPHHYPFNHPTCPICKQLRGIPKASDTPEEAMKFYWLVWISNIARDLQSGHCPQAIVEHIEKHFGPDLQKHILEEQEKGSTDWDCWLASAFNLLAIFQMIKFNYYRSPSWFKEKMIERLRVKYENNPETHTPPPNLDHAAITKQKD